MMKKNDAIKEFGIYYEVLPILSKFVENNDKPSNKDFFIRIIETLGKFESSPIERYTETYEDALKVAKNEIIKKEYPDEIFYDGINVILPNKNINLKPYIINEKLPEFIDISIKLDIGTNFYIFNENKLSTFEAKLCEYQVSNDVLYYVIKSDNFVHIFSEQKIENDKINNNIVGLHIFTKKENMFKFVKNFVSENKKRLDNLLNYVSKFNEGEK